MGGVSGVKGAFDTIVSIVALSGKTPVLCQKIVFLTEVDWMVDHQQQPINAASMEGKKSMV